MSVLSDLRVQVFEIAGGRCEHPAMNEQHSQIRCPYPAVELAHIVPRGMGHTGYRDVLGNVMAACWVHARSTDDLTHTAWDAVRVMMTGWEGVAEDQGLFGSWELRDILARYVNDRRQSEGVDLVAS